MWVQAPAPFTLAGMLSGEHNPWCPSLPLWLDAWVLLQHAGYSQCGCGRWPWTCLLPRPCNPLSRGPHPRCDMAMRSVHLQL